MLPQGGKRVLEGILGLALKMRQISCRTQSLAICANFLHQPFAIMTRRFSNHLCVFSLRLLQCSLLLFSPASLFSLLLFSDLAFTMTLQCTNCKFSCAPLFHFGRYGMEQSRALLLVLSLAFYEVLAIVTRYVIQFAETRHTSCGAVNIICTLIAYSHEVDLVVAPVYQLLVGVETK